MIKDYFGRNAWKVARKFFYFFLRGLKSKKFFRIPTFLVDGKSRRVRNSDDFEVDIILTAKLLPLGLEDSEPAEINCAKAY